MTRRLSDGEREVLAEQEADASDLADDDDTREIDAEQVEAAYRAACDEAARQREVQSE